MNRKLRDALLILAVFLGLATGVVAVTVTGVDTTSTQTLENKTIAHLLYTGKLTIGSINHETANFTVGASDYREHKVTTGSSADIVATLPATPTVGDTYDVCKDDTGSKHVVITKSGSQVIKFHAAGSANTYTLEFAGDCGTLQYWATNEWIARGDGT